MKLRPNLTVNYIRDKFEQVSIFSKFLDISEDTVIECIKFRSTILSPIRPSDNEPSVGFAYDNKGRLKMRDFNGSFWGDMFDVVSYLYKLPVSNKSDFYTILKIIYDSMMCEEYRDVISKDIKERLQSVKREKLVIDLNVREWNHNDVTLWEQWGLSIDDLDKGYVFPIENYWVNIVNNPEPKYFYRPNNPCYAYYLGYDEKGIVNYRLYFPIKSKFYPKFISNNQSMQGLTLLDKVYDGILITKSYKDVLLLRRLWDTYFCPTGGSNIGFVAPPSENYRFTEGDITTLKSHTLKGSLLSLFDFDYTGIHATNILKHEFNIPYLFLTNGRFNSPDHGAKDITDYYNNNGEQETVNLIETVLDLIL